jgi:hypothetical protein
LSDRLNRILEYPVQTLVACLGGLLQLTCPAELSKLLVLAPWAVLVLVYPAAAVFPQECQPLLLGRPLASLALGEFL